MIELRLYQHECIEAVELQARGIDMTSAIQQIQAERKPKATAVAGSKVVAFPKKE
jgi:hypothetical protein